MEKEVEQSPIELSESEKRKYLFLKQVNTLNAFRERNAISKEPTIKKSIGKAKKDEKIMKKSRHDEKATEQ